MRIAEVYSHLNGEEFLLVRKKRLWDEIQRVIRALDANACRTKISKEKRTKGRAFFSPIDMNRRMREGFMAAGWKASRTSYWVTKDASLIRKTLTLPPEEQKRDRKSVV